MTGGLQTPQPTFSVKVIDACGEKQHGGQAVKNTLAPTSASDAPCALPSVTVCPSETASEQSQARRHGRSALGQDDRSACLRGHPSSVHTDLPRHLTTGSVSPGGPGSSGAPRSMFKCRRCHLRALLRPHVRAGRCRVVCGSVVSPSPTRLPNRECPGLAITASGQPLPASPRCIPPASR